MCTDQKIGLPFVFSNNTSRITKFERSAVKHNTFANLFSYSCEYIKSLYKHKKSAKDSLLPSGKKTKLSNFQSIWSDVRKRKKKEGKTNYFIIAANTSRNCVSNKSDNTGPIYIMDYVFRVAMYSVPACICANRLKKDLVRMFLADVVLPFTCEVAFLMNSASG